MQENPKTQTTLFFFLLILSIIVTFLINLSSSSSWLMITTLFLLLLLPIVGLTFHMFNNLLLKPQILRWKIRRQGIDGPKPSFLYGNIHEMQRIQAQASSINGAPNSSSSEFVAHDYTSTLFPYFEQWRKQYGCIYTYSTGDKQHLYVNNAELVKEMSQSNTMKLGKPSYVTKRLSPMLGNGLLRANGHLWALQRKIIAPEFFLDKVKDKLNLMVESAERLVKKWEENIEAQGGEKAEIRVDEDLRNFSADMIARACFGSSYDKGKQIFSKLRTLQNIISAQSYLFGFPTLWKHKGIASLEAEVELLIWETVKERRERSSKEKDLLQSILEAAMNEDNNLGETSSRKFIVDNCKNMYFAGHEATAVAASWCFMLLACHPEWQSRIREETEQARRLDGKLDAESVSKMKVSTMVIHEVLRLYPPGAFVSREALEDTRIGHILVPKGVCMWTLIPTLHRDPEIWGPDANEFRPERFANGVSNACKMPQVFIPFGSGARLCVARNYAMVQLKVLLSTMVSNFSFSLSPKYKHSPAFRMVVAPGQGVHILIKRLKKQQ